MSQQIRYSIYTNKNAFLSVGDKVEWGIRQARRNMKGLTMNAVIVPTDYTPRERMIAEGMIAAAKFTNETPTVLVPLATITAAMDYARKFCEAYGEYVEQALACDEYGSHPDCGDILPTAVAFGHDLYFSATGTGVGFSDRDALGGLGERLHDVFRTHWREWHLEDYTHRGWMYFVS